MKARQNPFSLSRTTEPDRLDQIYRAAARIICEKGFESTSMNDIAEAVGLTKAGIYHHISGKGDLLFQIINFGLDALEEEVIQPSRSIADPAERLRAIVMGHARLITTRSTTEGNSPVSIVVDEMSNLTAPQRRKINQRKRDYVDLIRRTLDELKDQGELEDIDTTTATFSLLGMILWLARWYNPKGRLKPDDMAEQLATLAFNSLRLPAPKLSSRRIDDDSGLIRQR